MGPTFLCSNHSQIYPHNMRAKSGRGPTAVSEEGVQTDRGTPQLHIVDNEMYHDPTAHIMINFSKEFLRFK